MAGQFVVQKSVEHRLGGLRAEAVFIGIALLERKPLPPAERFEGKVFRSVRRNESRIGKLSLPGAPEVDQAVVIDATVRRPKSRGFVRLRSADPDEPPVIDFRYFRDEEAHDERVLVAGAKICRRIMEQPAMAQHLSRELFPGADITSDEAISETLRANAISVEHPAGTCKMGGMDDEMAVVAPDLKVRGFQNLRVADTSIFPTMLSVSPNITAMMIGEKCAELVRGG